VSKKVFIVKTLLFMVLIFGFELAGKAVDSTNRIDVFDETVNGKYKIRLVISLNRFSGTQVHINNSNFDLLTMPGYGYTCDIGKPQLPSLRVLLAVPPAVMSSVGVECSDFYVLPGNYRILPVQEPQSDLQRSTQKFDIDNALYSQSLFYPDELVEIGDRVTLRDYEAMQFEIFPFKYNPATKEVRFYFKLVIELEFEGEPVKQSKSPLIEDFYEGVIYNYDDAADWPVTSEPAPEREGLRALSAQQDYDYLMIVYDDFYESLLPLRDSKVQSGLAVEVIKTSQIPDEGDGLDDEDVRNYITDQYIDRGITYVLLVGDIEYIPTHYALHQPAGGESFLQPTDHYYSTVDGNDYFSDVFVGRIPVKNTAELDVVVSKIINYEKAERTEDTDWYKKATLFYSGEQEKWRLTTEFVSDLFAENGYIHIDIFNDSEHDSNDIIEAINEGRGFLVYRGHSNLKCWIPVSFCSLDALTLENGWKLPVGISCSCNTGLFAETAHDCLGETLLKGDTAKYPNVNGCVAFFGSAGISFTGYNDELEKGIFKAIFNDNITTFAKATNKAKLYMYSYYGHSYYSPLHFDLYNNLGDPSLQMWTDTPTPRDSLIFSVKNSVNEIVASFDNDGNLILKGILTQRTQIDEAPTDSFVIVDSSDNIISYIDSQGNMYIEEILLESQDGCDPAIRAFVVKNSAGDVVSCIDYVGNLYLTGRLYENTNP
jgi:hypothetical protein